MSVINALFVNMGKVIPYFKMTPELAQNIHSTLAKVMMYAKSKGIKLTQKQQDYIMNQTKQLDMYEKSLTPPTPKGPKAEVIDLSKKLPEEAPYSEKNPKGWMPSESEMIELGNPSVAERTGGMLRETKSRGIMSQTTFDEKLVNDTIDLLKSKTDEKSFQNEIKKIIGRKGTYEDYSDAEIKGVLDGIEKKVKKAEDIIDEGDFDPSGMKDGGRIGYAKGGLNYLMGL